MREISDTADVRRRYGAKFANSGERARDGITKKAKKIRDHGNE